MQDEARRAGAPRDRIAAAILASEPIASFVSGRAVHWIEEQAPTGMTDPIAAADVVVAYRKLQDVVDYRAVLRDWLERLRAGGHLIVIVPHAFLYERAMTLPSPWRDGQRRLYTPGALLAEVEEALLPNSYRVRWVGDIDGSYDYVQAPDLEPAGDSDVGLVLERIAPPAWPVAEEPVIAAVPGAVPTLPVNNFAFEPPRTRIEAETRIPIRRVCILKLDHLGDLIMGLPALEKARRLFADAWIDLVVGSWNEAMARDLGLADRVIAFDAFPRNSSEEKPDVAATLGQFRLTIADNYDLAIDLRADVDTRVLLQTVKAPVKAAIGTRAYFPFLDIALPLDSTRNEAERVREVRLAPGAFEIQGSGRRGHFGLHSDKATVEHNCAIVWGPYLELDPGDYIFDFYIDLEADRGEGLLRLDVALDRGRQVSEMFVSGPSNFHLTFRVDKPKTVFEARIFTVEGRESISFGFYGGHLIKRGPGNVLHQSEYASLLIELVKLRMLDQGLLGDVGNMWRTGA